jgi:hypothetical protein
MLARRQIDRAKHAIGAEDRQGTRWRVIGSHFRRPVGIIGIAQDQKAGAGALKADCELLGSFAEGGDLQFGPASFLARGELDSGRNFEDGDIIRV